MPKAVAYTLSWSSLHLAYELRAPDGDVVLRMQHEEPAWFTWLAQGTSFAFEGRTPADCCLLRQETKQRGAGYWYAYQRNGKKAQEEVCGKGRCCYLGPAGGRGPSSKCWPPWPATPVGDASAEWPLVLLIYF
jgi:hypothetical protein